MSYQVRNAKRLAALPADAPRWRVDRATERGSCVVPSWQLDKGFSTVGALKAFCEVNNRGLDICPKYGEPGYSSPEKGILFTNWNDIPKALQTRLEAQGYALEWEDEWYIDYDSGKAYRTSPSSYGWQCQVHFTEDGGVLTPDTAVDDWLTEALNNPRFALPSWISAADIEGAGFERKDDIFENGFHPGQNDNPEKIGAELTRRGYDYVFQLTHVRQFDIRFHVFTREIDREG